MITQKDINSEEQVKGLSLNESNDYYSLILHSGENTPKFFSFKKKTVKKLLILIPTITILAILSTLILTAYFKQIRVYAKRKEPRVIQQLRENKKELIQKNQGLLELVSKLNKKLSTSDISSGNSLGALDIFKRPAGQQDLTKSPIVDADGVKVEVNKSSTGLAFNIVNLTPDNRKLGGYFFILQREGSTFNIFPNHSFLPSELKTSFTKGESFATSRFRPVLAKLAPVKNLNKTLFKIIIFSRTGDLLLHKVISGENLGK